MHQITARTRAGTCKAKVSADRLDVQTSFCQMSVFRSLLGACIFLQYSHKFAFFFYANKLRSVN